MLDQNLWGRLQLIDIAQEDYLKTNFTTPIRAAKYLPWWLALALDLVDRLALWLYLFKVQICIWLNWQQNSSSSQPVLNMGDFLLIPKLGDDKRWYWYLTTSFVYTPLSFWNWTYGVYTRPFTAGDGRQKLEKLFEE